MSKCKGCGAEIIWIKTITGKNMPVDAKPEKRVLVYKDLPEGTISNFIPDYGTVVTVYTPHWASCPKAQDFKSKK